MAILCPYPRPLKMVMWLWHPFSGGQTETQTGDHAIRRQKCWGSWVVVKLKFRVGRTPQSVHLMNAPLEGQALDLLGRPSKQGFCGHDFDLGRQRGGVSSWPPRGFRGPFLWPFCSWRATGLTLLGFPTMLPLLSVLVWLRCHESVRGIVFNTRIQWFFLRKYRLLLR